jgi:hypothetical protein
LMQGYHRLSYTKMAGRPDQAALDPSNTGKTHLDLESGAEPSGAHPVGEDAKRRESLIISSPREFPASALQIICLRAVDRPLTLVG